MSAVPVPTGETLTTIECGRPGQRYTLVEHGPSLVVHLAAPVAGGTGPCICGYDRFAAKVGFSVGGGTTGPNTKHEVCADCANRREGRPVGGLHAALFSESDPETGRLTR